MVKDILDKDEILSKYTYYDQTLPCAPNLKRPDFTYVLVDRIVILEVDEHAHRYYNRECEIARITALMEQAGGQPLLLLRFNPLQRCIGEMKHCLVEMMLQTNLEKMLYVEFVGYNGLEYDVVKEMEALSCQRR